jgi:hypothetical protein
MVLEFILTFELITHEINSYKPAKHSTTTTRFNVAISIKIKKKQFLPAPMIAHMERRIGTALKLLPK